MAQPPQQPVNLFPGIGKHHNLMDVGNFLSSMSSAQFMIDHFDNARPFAERSQVYGWALSQTNRDGLVLEFGVAAGTSVNILATHHHGPVYGFDVFSGLPETWRPGFPKGAFAQPKLPDVRENVELVVGLFEDTLPEFLSIHAGRVKLLHVDCDIYSGTATIFSELEARIDDNTIIIFDEYLNYPGWEKGEHKAFVEFCERSGRRPEYLAFVPGSEQVVARAIKIREAVASPHPIRAAADGGLRHVKHMTFDELITDGHSVEHIKDDAAPLELDNLDVPENWARPQPVIEPRAATLRDAALFQDGSFLMPNGHYCYYDATFNIEPWRKHHNRSVLRCIDPEFNDALIRPHARSIVVPGRCFSALSNTAHNFGHFIHDILSRIYYEDLGVIAPGREIIIAPQFRFRMQEILFEKVFEGYEIVQAPSGTTIQTEELVVPANLCSSTRFNPKGIESLARRMRAIMEVYAGKEFYRVCVSRRDGKQSGGRDFANVDDFEAEMAKLGYEVITASELAPEAQFALWANTRDIVGIHGAGLMNMIMMPPGRYTEITAAPRGPVYTARCAAAAGHRVYGLAGILNEKGEPEIDLGKLKALMRSRG